MKRLVLTVVSVILGALGVALAAPAGAAGPASVRPAAAASLRLMPLGDSITWGVGSSTGNGYRAPL